MKRLRRVFRSLLLPFLFAGALVGCSGGGGGSNDKGPTEATIDGTVTGLADGATVVLQNNDGDDLLITTNGDFSFSVPVAFGNEYDVSVLTQPINPHQTCTVNAGSGVSSQNITPILVACITNAYTVSGSVSGLVGAGLELQNNGGDNLSVSADGEFSFATSVESGSSYKVTIGTQPNSPSQTCEVTGGSGDVVDQNISSIVVACTTNTYEVGGTVTGLIGSGLVLKNNGWDDLPISVNGNFSFTTEISSGDSYDVAVDVHPSNPDQTCFVIDGSGTVTDLRISSVKISCSKYSIGVTVSGLVSGESLTLQNNGGDDLVVTGNGGPFLFNTLLHDFLPYDVSISVQPGTSTQQCMVVNGNGTIASADVLDIAIVCPNVSLLYPNNGANWNDYINNNGANGFTADDTLCDGMGESYASCLHAGEMRAVELVALASCSDITAEDELNAFNWTCDESAGVARLISTSLKEGASLSSLIDFNNTQWRENAVIIKQFGIPVARTPASKWWDNSIIVANSGGSLNTEGVIYLVTADPSANYILDADKVGLVIQPGLEISGGSGGDFIYANGYSYLWFEGGINAGGKSSGVFWENVTHSVMYGARVRDASIGNNVVLLNSSNNKLNNIRVSSAISHGLVLDNSHFNALSAIVATNNQNAGVYVTGSHGNVLTGIIAANNDNGSNAEGGGIILTHSSDNKFINITIANNMLSGFVIDTSPNNVLMNIVAANNYTSILMLNNSNSITTANLVVADNSRRGILLRDVSNNYFTGTLKVGGNAGGDCGVQGVGTAPGLIDTRCSDTGVDGSSVYTGQLSDAVLKTNVSVGQSFVGKVLIDDVANTSDLNGSATYSGITDWINFANSYRVWSLDGDPFPSVSHKGPFPLCEGYVAYNETDCMMNGGMWRSDGRIWDWSLALGDVGDNGNAVLNQVLTLPGGDDTITHNWSDVTSTVFLRNAIEIFGDAIGNDDGLCGSNEACIYTPNIGVYQGHGNLSSAGEFADSVGSGVTGVLLYQYETNSY